MEVEFDKIDGENVDVMGNNMLYGKLTFDDDKKLWVLWPNDIDDGVGYFSSLNETEETIQDELVTFSKEA